MSAQLGRLMKWVIGIIVLAALCLLAICNGFIITRYRTGEQEDIRAVQKRFILYSQVPFFKTEGRLYFLERITIPYHTIDVFGVFADDLDVFENSKDISDFESSFSSQGFGYFTEKEIARLPAELCKEYNLQQRDGGYYLLGADGQEQRVKEFRFRTAGTYCFCYIDLESKKFILSICAR